MRASTPTPHLLASAGWLAAVLVLFPFLVPPDPLYRTVVAGVAVVLFCLALWLPRAGFALALLSVAASGVSALVFGQAEPASIGGVLAFAYFSGAALRSLYELDAPSPSAPLLAAWRSLAAAWGVSALSAVVTARTAYLLVRSVPPPRVANVLGLDAFGSMRVSAAAAAAMAVAAGFHRAAARLSRDAAGRRFLDRVLVVAALLPGLVALLQKLGALPVWRAARWGGWGRAQSLFTDPSSAGVAAALLLAPLLARAMSGGTALRIASAAGVALLVALVSDSGSRAGLVGAVTSGSLLLLSIVTRVAAGEKPGLRRRMAGFVGGTAILLALGFVAAVSWPSPGGARSPLVARVEASLSASPSPAEDPGKRLILYRAALVLFGDRPFAGGGIGSYPLELPDVAADRLGRPVTASDWAPSFYLGTLAEAGTAGAILLALLLAGLGRGCSAGLALGEPRAEEALRSAGAAAATVGLLVVLLFGSHLVYPEIAALFGVLTARLTIRPEGRTTRLLTALVPVATAGALVVMIGGILARGYETWGPAVAFLHGPSAGVYGVEREPGGRPFHWARKGAAFSVVAPEGVASRVVLPLKNARPDAAPLGIELFWNDRPAARLELAAGEWTEAAVPVRGAGVLRLRASAAFRPGGRELRTLAVETGEPRVVPVSAPPPAP